MATKKLDKKYLESPDGKLCTDLDKKFARCVTMRQEFERQWYLNIAFYFGRQWVGWSGERTSGKYTLQDYKPRNTWEVRVTANKVQPVIRNELTKLSKEEPQYYVIPATSENEDLAAARAGELIAEHTLDVGGFNRARREATWWALQCGSGFITDYAKGGDSAGDYGKVIPDQIITKNVPTFNLYVPNLQVPEIEDQPYIYNAYTADPESLYAAYGEEIPHEDLPAGADFQKRLLQMMGINNDMNFPSTLVKEVYIKPNHKFPDGAMLVTAGGKLLYMNEKLKEIEEPGVGFNGKETKVKKWTRYKDVTDEEIAIAKGKNDTLAYKTCEYPYKHRQYPYAKIDHIPSGRFYGLSVIEGMIPLQKEYNRARSQIRMGANLTSSPQWTYEQGSIEDPRKLTNRPGVAIPYRTGMKPPEPVKNPEYPAYAIQDQDRILKDIDDFTGQYEVSHGRTPPGVEAASAIAYLQEENDTRLYHTSASIEEATQKIGYQCLSLIQQLWSSEKIIRVTSRNNRDDVEAFKVADMKGNTDFRVEPGSMAPKSRAARQALVLELMKGGYIEAKDGLQYLHLVETNRMWEDMQIDSRQVQRENMMFKKKGQVMIHSYDNHAMHVLYHERWMKTQDYELLDEAIKEQVELHLQAHKMELIKLQPQPQLGEDPASNVGNGTEPAGNPNSGV